MSEKKTALIVGASRGLGLGLAQEFLRRSWGVVATIREGSQTKLRDLISASNGALEIEHVDITEPEQIASLKTRLANRCFDMLFVNAGVANSRLETIAEVSTEEFVRVMVTNALSVMRVVEAFYDNVGKKGALGVMSSGLGSVADNEGGGFEIYRASKSALNTLVRSFVARRGKDRAVILMAPGWIKTDMGGPEATFTLEEAMPQIVDTLIAQSGKKGLQYLDRFGKTVRW